MINFKFTNEEVRKEYQTKYEGLKISDEKVDDNMYCNTYKIAKTNDYLLVREQKKKENNNYEYF